MTRYPKMLSLGPIRRTMNTFALEGWIASCCGN